MDSKRLICGVLFLSFLMPVVYSTISEAAITSKSNSSTTKALAKEFNEAPKITDLELRAEAGSFSKYSMKFIFGYSGPQINRLSEEVQPNPNNSPGRHLANVSGSTNLRYRLSQSEALSMGVGIRAYTPFSGLKDEEYSNPSISYDKTYRWGGVQGRSSIFTSYTTTEDYRSRGQVASSGVSQSLKYYLGASSWVVGSSLSLSLYHFSRDYVTSDGKVSNYYLNWIPSLEYRLSDGINVNTSIAVPFANLRRSGDLTQLDPQFMSQRFGLGWAITPEVYFNPYIGFYPEKLGWDNASASFSLIFSLL